MKKKSMLKRMAAVFMGTVMLLGTAGAVSAATAPDLSGQGSLQIFKQDENKEPIADVTFNYVEIGEFYQSEGTPVLGYTITNDELLGYLKTEDLLLFIQITEQRYMMERLCSPRWLRQ